MKKYSKSLSDLFNYIFTGTVVRLLPLIILPYAAVSLGEKDFGIFSLFRLYASLGTAFVLLGIEQGLFRLVPSSDTNMRHQYTGSALIFVMLVGLFAGIIYLIYSDSFQSALFDTGELFPDFLLPLLIILSALNSVITTRYGAEKISAQYLFRNLTRSLTFFLVFGGGLLSGYGLKAFFAAYLISELLIFFPSLSMIYRSVRAHISFKMMTEMLCIGFPLFGLMLITLLLGQSDHYLIKIFLGVEQTGIYNYAYRFTTAISIFVLLSNNVWMPRLFEKGESFIHQHLKDYSSLIMIACSTIYFGLLAVFRVWADLLIPAGFEDVWQILLFVGFGYLFYGHSQLLSSLLILQKNTRPLLTLSLAGLILNIILNVVYIPRYGILAAGIITTISFVFIWSLLMINLKVKFKTYDFRSLLLEFTLIIIPALTVMLTQRLWLSFTVWMIAVAFLLLRNTFIREILRILKS